MPTDGDLCSLEGYVLRCCRCGNKQGLVTITLKKRDQLIGLLFSCASCFPYLVERRITFSWAEEEEG